MIIVRKASEKREIVKDTVITDDVRTLDGQETNEIQSVSERISLTTGGNPAIKNRGKRKDSYTAHRRGGEKWEFLSDSSAFYFSLKLLLEREEMEYNFEANEIGEII